MNVTFTSLEALVLKATSESLTSPDAAAVEAFYSIMRTSPEGPQLAAQALASRVHSRNPKEALLTLEMLERCLRRGDPRFLTEVGKFRFLNELIMLVSPKYFAERTAPEVKTKILQLFYVWANQHQSKFRVAYDMLQNQGVIKEPPLPLPSEENENKVKTRKSVIFDDEEKSKLLQKLLQSKKPEDLQHANRLIKNMVREEERKTEADGRCMQEVFAALESAELLQEMLLLVKNPTSDDEQLIQEVYANCIRLVPILHQLASANINSENLACILNASDMISEALTKHRAYLQRRKSTQAQACQVPSSRASSNTAVDHSLLDFAGAARAQGDASTEDRTVNQSSLEELGDIFSVNDCESASATDSVMSVMPPVTILEADEVTISGDNSQADHGWGELNSLSEQMLKQSLPTSTKRIDGFTSKSTKKIPMNSLEKPTKNITQCDSITTTSNTLLDLDFFTKKYEDDKSSTRTSCHADTTDDLILDISTDTETPNEQVKETPAEVPSENSIATTNVAQGNLKSPIEENNLSEMFKEMKADEVKTLNDIVISIRDVRPSRLSPVRAFEEEDGLAVILHFCRDRPRVDVNVLVVSTTSKKTSAIEDYKFQAFVPKGCKVRLLEQSKDCLPAYNPFFPPPSLTQLMLLARPPGLSALCLKFVITYSMDGETHSEIGEVKQLPLDCL